MIALDEEWLDSLRFTAVEGVEVDGLAGVGNEKVVLKGYLPNGKKVALQTMRWHLGYYIKEIPPFLLADQNVDSARLNSKLNRLVGDPLLDQACGEYNRLFALLIAQVLEKDIVSVSVSSAFAINLIDSVPFLLSTPSVHTRLQEVATLSDEEDGDPFVTLNGPFRIADLRGRVRQKAEKALADLKKLAGSNLDFEPERLFDDPVVIWLAAVMDGFFSEEQFDSAAQFISAKFGALTDDPRCGTRVLHLSALLDAYTFYLRKKEDRAVTRRAVQFLARCGCVIDVSDHNGKLVASGMRALMGEPVGPKDEFDETGTTELQTNSGHSSTRSGEQRGTPAQGSVLSRLVSGFWNRTR